MIFITTMSVELVMEVAEDPSISINAWFLLESYFSSILLFASCYFLM